MSTKDNTAFLIDVFGYDFEALENLLGNIKLVSSWSGNEDDSVYSQVDAVLMALEALKARLRAIQERSGFKVDESFYVPSHELRWKLDHKPVPVKAVAES